MTSSAGAPTATVTSLSCFTMTGLDDGEAEESAVLGRVQDVAGDSWLHSITSDSPSFTSPPSSSITVE